MPLVNAETPCDTLTIQCKYNEYKMYYLAVTFIRSDLQLIRLIGGQPTVQQCGVPGLAQGPNSCVDLIVATPGLEPPTFRVPVMYH